ncbi:Carnitine O-palmitoyltransferase 1 liver isoform [Fasciolopsis buskii]|uniref:Carnitine O-palmitoyltransferase 1 liver isoform n=1 Tax=Fasciolopsis buskii TaxID=27845 RepID=A0A8E0VM33_9TREM|nr:Carnitine O-palmitoyltransferase 1 liver isoform [Fasciolopsis buski]
MAEAHAAVAFSFTVSSEGISVDINRQAAGVLRKSGTRALKKRIARFKNSLYNQVYPFHPSSWFYFAFGVFGATYLGYDYKKSPLPYIEEFLIRYLGLLRCYHVPACLIFSLMLWFVGSMINQLCLRALLGYTGWMYLPRNVKSLKVALWSKAVQFFKSRHPRLYGYQYSLPALPLPRLKDTISKCMLSVKHLKTPEEYDELVRGADMFLRGPGPKLQIYLCIKTWITSNYVSDWWEEYIYLAGRDPIMSNSNFYGLEWMRTRPIRPTQAASAAMITYLMCQVRRQLIREEIPPIQINNLIPLCSWQYERVFNTTRIPCVNKDKLVHLPDSTHIAALYRGCYYRCPVVVEGRQLTAAELEHVVSTRNIPGEYQKSFVTYSLFRADAPIISHVCEIVTVSECEGIDRRSPGLQYCIEVIESSLAIAQNLANAIDLVVMSFSDYGRCFIKRAGYSPDAYIQMALQVAYYLADERTSLFKVATDRHQLLTRDAISVAFSCVCHSVRCVFCCSPQLKSCWHLSLQILSEPWRLSTSQTPTNQTLKMTLPPTHPDSNRIYGGGFGPVDKHGYGVSYIFSMENSVCFHVSSRHDCTKTSSKHFMENIVRSMHLIRDTLVASSKKSLPDRLWTDKDVNIHGNICPRPLVVV